MNLNKKTIIAGVVVFALIVIGAWYFLSRPNNPGDTGMYYDKNSGETVSDPTGKAPDKFGVKSDQPIFLGVSKLLDYGVSQSQVDEMKYAFYQFSKSHGMGVKEVSIGVDSIKTIPFKKDDPNPKTSVLFNAILDRKSTYQAKMEFSDISSMRLVLSQDGSNVYDSGVLTGVPAQ